MFGLFKKDEKKDDFFALSTGELIRIEDVQDPVFSQKIMGDGFAINPEDNDVFSPISGTVVSIFPTKHAINLKTDNGLDVLVHLGIDTVELNGEPFNILVEEGQHVDSNVLMAKIDREKIMLAGKQDTLMVIITNMDLVKNLKLNKNGLVKANEYIADAILK